MIGIFYDWLIIYSYDIQKSFDMLSHGFAIIHESSA